MKYWKFDFKLLEIHLTADAVHWIDIFTINDHSLLMVQYDDGDWWFDLFFVRRLVHRFQDWRESRCQKD